MRALGSIRVIGLIGASSLLCGLPGCAGQRRFELPADIDVPPHECSRSGIAACERACDEQSDGDACLVASAAHAGGHGGPVNEASMRDFELRACQLDVAQGCEHYANNFSESKSEEDLGLARKYFELACEGGRAKSCARAGLIALRLDAGGQPRDASAAFALYERACSTEVVWACSVVGDMLVYGIGTPKDVERAAASYRIACDGDDDIGCHNVEGGQEHWITGPAALVLLEVLHSPDPPVHLEQKLNGWRSRLAARVCVARDAAEPSSVEIISSSRSPELDDAVRETLQEWRFRVRPEWNVERNVCLEHRFDIGEE